MRWADAGATCEAEKRIAMDPLQDLAARLLACDTTSHRSNRPAMALLAERLEPLGFTVREQVDSIAGVEKANLVATIGPPVPGGLVLCGHVDTVPFDGQPGWASDPLQLEERGGRLYGRGTSDMKVFLAQCVVAAGRLELGQLRRPLVIVVTGDEEIGALGAARLVPVLDSLLAGVPRPRLAWIGEPTSWQRFHAHKGVVDFTVTVHGIGGHSSLPEAGVNAIAVAGKLLRAVARVQADLRAERSAEMEELFPGAGYVSVNPGTIRGGTALNMIAERCEIGLSYRPLPGGDPLDPYHRIRAAMEEVDLRDDGGGDSCARIVVSAPGVTRAMRCRPGTALEKALDRSSCDPARPEQPGARGAPFATDGGELATLGIDSVVCGPGDLDQAHQPNESISVREFVRGPQRIADVVQALCVAGIDDARGEA